MAKKTFNIREFTEEVNRMLAESTCTADQRMGMILLLERTLMDSGNYHGYAYLSTDDVPSGHKGGHFYDATGPGWSTDGMDDTRRRYIIK